MLSEDGKTCVNIEEQCFPEERLDAETGECVGKTSEEFLYPFSGDSVNCVGLHLSLIHI